MRFAPLLAVLALSAAFVGAAAPGVADVDTDRSPLRSGAATPTPAPAASTADTSTADASTSAVSAAGAVANAANESNQTHVIAIPDAAIKRSTIERVRLNLGPAAEFGANASAIRMRTLAIEERVEAADTPETRSQRILAALTRLEGHVNELARREQRAIAAYNRDAITAERLAIRLAEISDEADALEARLVALQQLAKETEGFELNSSRVEAIRFDLRAFDGPVRDRAAAALLGKTDPARIFVQTGPQGVVLTTIENETYVREAYRGALRNRKGGNVTAAEALKIAAQNYPVIWKNRLPGGVEATGSGNTFVVRIPHTRGMLVAFVDTGSKRVFKEFQRIPLAKYVSPATATNAKSGLRLTVNRTYPGGPLRIHVTDAETGDPVDATVTISQGPEEGTVIGTTGADGTIWTLSPRGQFTVLAIRGQTAAVFVEVQPTEPPTTAR